MKTKNDERESVRRESHRGNGQGGIKDYARLNHHSVNGNYHRCSFLFFNFPDKWEVKQMWETFKYHGSIVEIYMAKKRLRKGKRFGFVRFKGVKNVGIMEVKLNGIWIGSYRLRVFIANQGLGEKGKEGNPFNRKWETGKGNRDGRSYKEVDKPKVEKNKEGSSSIMVEVNEKKIMVKKRGVHC